jgi:hypothetical protein
MLETSTRSFSGNPVLGPDRKVARVDGEPDGERGADDVNVVARDWRSDQCSCAATESGPAFHGAFHVKDARRGKTVSLQDPISRRTRALDSCGCLESQDGRPIRCRAHIP